MSWSSLLGATAKSLDALAAAQAAGVPASVHLTAGLDTHVLLLLDPAPNQR